MQKPNSLFHIPEQQTTHLHVHLFIFTLPSSPVTPLTSPVHPHLTFVSGALRNYAEVKGTANVFTSVD